MKLRDLEALKAAQLEDARGKLVDPEAHEGELTAGRRWHRARLWFSAELAAWTARLERGGRWAKAVAMIVVSIATVAGVLWRAVVFYKTRGGAPAEQPATGVASTAVDRVPKPKPPLP